MCDEFLGDLLEEELENLGKAAFVVGVSGFLLKQAIGARSFLRGDPVQNSIVAHLPQGYDRSIIAARVSQPLTKSLMIDALAIGAIKERLRRATTPGDKVAIFSELFNTTLAGILSAAYIHSLTITLHVMRHTMSLLVFVLGKQEASSGTRRADTSLLSKFRSWWHQGTQNFMLQTLLENMTQQMEASPFSLMMDDDNMKTEDVKQGFCVDALLRLAVPRVVDTALHVVNTTLEGRDSQLFNLTGSVTEGEMRDLLQTLCAKFVSRATLSDWLTPPSEELKDSDGGVLNTSPPPQGMGDGESGGESPGGRDKAMSNGDSLLSNDEQCEDRLGLGGGGGGGMPLQGVFPPLSANFFPMTNGAAHAEEMHAAHRNRLIHEKLRRERAAGFFREIVHSVSLSELCIAYTEELLGAAVAVTTDFSSLRPEGDSTVAVRVPQMLPLLEKQRLDMFDCDFQVQPYVRLLCEETIRVTCRDL
ncbi:hypothetical protein DPX39_110074200 [Trypanosoma brucei equiperdum]|uniref:Uncharacterized protein n=1 Tax=Trypanosoma brucei equiperdum TaxID=630700 RepID=A0A3L6KUU6_9TRYP|nr:hypothetical protein DPX39_110074200 [Trypanosoma brucei equiperdum]